MYGLKLVVVAVAMLGMGAAAIPDVVGPCFTAAAVTTTVTVTTCGQPTPPAVLSSESSNHGTPPSQPPPAETSWLSPTPAPAPAPAPAPSSPAQPVPGHSSSAPPSQGESSQAPPAPPASSESSVSSVEPSGESHLSGHSSIATTTATESSPLSPTDSSPIKSDRPYSPHTGKPTPINAGSFKSVSLGMGCIVAAGMAFSAGITLLV